MHKKGKKKNLNILLIPDNETSPRNFRVRYSTLQIGAILLVIFFVSLIYGIVNYSQALQGASRKDTLERENAQLKEQLEKAVELRAELNEVQAYKERVVNSFQGFVKFAEGQELPDLDPAVLSQADGKKQSIFTTVPLKTPVQGFISQDYQWPGHLGIDIVAAINTPIHAAADGVVAFSDFTASTGYLVIIYHRSGYLSFYRHNQRNVVSVNQFVKQGDTIAFLGNSGESSSGPHLHFEVWKDGAPMDPRELLFDLKSGD